MIYVPTVACATEPADVAELVDALVSGTSGSNVVGVQVSPSALSCWNKNSFTFGLMIFLKISNASELVASKLGGFVESITPDFIDDSTVEDLVIKRMIENLANEGIKGEVSSVKGVEVEGDQLLLNEGFKVRNNREF